MNRANALVKKGRGKTWKRERERKRDKKKETRGVHRSVARKTRKRVLERGLEKDGGRRRRRRRRVPTIPSAWHFRLALKELVRRGREGTRRKASPMATWREITFPQLAPQTFLFGSRFSPRLLRERRCAVATGIQRRQPFHRPLSNLYLAFWEKRPIPAVRVPLLLHASSVYRLLSFLIV